jgi:aspartate/methionine/tyrosine aminotransferase
MSHIVRMIRIRITAEAYQAICAGVPEDSRLPAQGSPQGGFYLWLDKSTLNKLSASRRPGEGYSEAILRMAKVGA